MRHLDRVESIDGLGDPALGCLLLRCIVVGCIVVGCIVIRPRQGRSA